MRKHKSDISVSLITTSV